MNDLISREYLLSLASAEGAYEYVSAEEIAKAPTVPAIPIPKNATNGDVLKRLLYGKAIITEFIQDVNISVNNNVIGQFDMEWWRSPYKRGETE